MAAVTGVVECLAVAKYEILSKSWIFWGAFRFTENMKFVLKGRIRCTFRVFPGPFYCSRGPSLVELTEGDDSATSTVAVIRMSLKEYA